MNSHRVLTIGREYGRGSGEIDRLLAGRLGRKLYDRELVAEVARAAHLDWRQLGDATSRAGQRAAVPLVRRQSKPALKRPAGATQRERPSEKWRATPARASAPTNASGCGTAATLAVLKGS